MYEKVINPSFVDRSLAYKRLYIEGFQCKAIEYESVPLAFLILTQQSLLDWN